MINSGHAADYASLIRELRRYADPVEHPSGQRGIRARCAREDSGNHLNNFLWAWRVADGKLTRLASAPIGAEWTGLQVVENANGFAYLMSNVQHPGAANDLGKYPEEICAGMRAGACGIAPCAARSGMLWHKAEKSANP